eukprot:15352865-Ditylum_brightwellii.AAC.1
MLTDVAYFPFILGLTVAAKLAAYTCGWKPCGAGMNIGGVLGGMCCIGSGDTGLGGISFFFGHVVIVTLGSVVGHCTVPYLPHLSATTNSTRPV